MFTRLRQSPLGSDIVRAGAPECVLNTNGAPQSNSLGPRTGLQNQNQESPLRPVADGSSSQPFWHAKKIVYEKYKNTKYKIRNKLSEVPRTFSFERPQKVRF